MREWDPQFWVLNPFIWNLDQPCELFHTGIDPDSHGTVVNQGASSGTWPGATAVADPPTMWPITWLYRARYSTLTNDTLPDFSVSQWQPFGQEEPERIHQKEINRVIIVAYRPFKCFITERAEYRHHLDMHYRRVRYFRIALKKIFCVLKLAQGSYTVSKVKFKHLPRIFKLFQL